MNPNKVPDSILRLSNSSDIYIACEKIGSEFGLYIDQIGELDAQIRHILRGYSKTQNFKSDIRRILGVNDDVALAIADRVNTQIFKPVKAELMSQEESDIAKNQTSSIERAGNFTLEKDVESEESSLATVDMPSGDRVNLLSNKPDPSTYREPLIDQLLRGSTAIPQEKTVIKSSSTSTQSAPSNPPTGNGGPDPYREPVK